MVPCTRVPFLMPIFDPQPDPRSSPNTEVPGLKIHPTKSGAKESRSPFCFGRQHPLLLDVRAENNKSCQSIPERIFLQNWASFWVRQSLELACTKPVHLFRWVLPPPGLGFMELGGGDRPSICGNPFCLRLGPGISHPPSVSGSRFSG